MSLSSTQLPKAEKEIIDSWQWYEDQEIGLGDRFVIAIRKKIDQIEENPLHFPVKRSYRQAVVNGFPYIILFRIDKVRQIILIMSVFHTSRNPKRKLK